MDPSKVVRIKDYKLKMDHYEGVFDAVINDFNDSMFGSYSNSVNRKTFQLQLMSEGWKYFDLNNLNELFSIKYEEQLEKGLISAPAKINGSLRIDPMEIVTNVPGAMRPS